MSQSTSSSSPPSLTDLLSALQTYLCEPVRLCNLPTVLQIFAHFELLSRSIVTQAQCALQEHRKRRQELLANPNVRPEEFEQYGCLSPHEEEQIERYAQRDRDERMCKFSMSFRRHHIALLLSQPALELSKTRSIIEAYFPNLAIDKDRLWEKSDYLHIRLMTESQASIALAFRQEVLEWEERVALARVRGGRHLSYQDLTGVRADQAKKRTDKFAAKLLQCAEDTVRDAEDFKAIFEDEDDGSGVNGEGNAEPEVKVEEDLDEAEQEQGGRGIVDASTREFLEGRRQETAESERAFRRASMPARPSQWNTTARLPRASLPGHRAGDVYTHNEAERTAMSDSSTAQVEQREQRKRGSDAEYAEARKRPRTSGLPPPEGPDYTAPVPAMGSNVAREELHPFDNSALYRRQPAGSRKSRLSDRSTDRRGHTAPRAI